MLCLGDIAFSFRSLLWWAFLLGRMPLTRLENTDTLGTRSLLSLLVRALSGEQLEVSEAGSDGPALLRGAVSLW